MMSIKLLVESVEQARINNENLSTAVEGKLNLLLGKLGAAQSEVDNSLGNLSNAMEELKQFLHNEFQERNDDLIRLIEGAA